MLKILRSVALSLLIWLAASIVVGVAACFVMDVVPHKYFSPPLAYAIWGVLGVFVGLFHFGFSQSQIKGTDGISDWASVDEAKKIGGQIVLLTALLLATMSAVFYPLFWSSQSNLEVLFLVVPDNMGVTLTFFIAILAATAFTNNLFSPSEKPR
jgi:xanthosine utilization system XapX-like protein